MAFKQPWRSDLTSDFKFMAQTTYAIMFVRTVLVLFLTLTERKKEENLSIRVVGFAATKKNPTVGQTV